MKTTDKRVCLEEAAAFLLRRADYVSISDINFEELSELLSSFENWKVYSVFITVKFDLKARGDELRALILDKTSMHTGSAVEKFYISDSLNYMKIIGAEDSIRDESDGRDTPSE